MAAIHYLGCLKEALHTLGDPIFYLHTKFSKAILINGRDIPQKLDLKQSTLAAEFYFRF